MGGKVYLGVVFFIIFLQMVISYSWGKLNGLW